MKKLILICTALFAIVFMTLSCDDKDNDYQVPSSSLPVPASSFLDTHFKGIHIRTVEKLIPTQTNGTVYSVDLVNGIEVDFDQEGTWKEVEGDNNAAIPTSFILPSIVTYVTTNYPAIKINTIDKVISTFEIELTNDIDLLFDMEGKFIRVLL
ncbi:PepSY-like domain-containing protein [Sphingobacterium sp. SRCM116780]|uniref:PepSY-like domain-containing protein n=1 Tax=Sphingobacterium sp. SRCM116780 TaxID=2907623 RepID=UPI001F3D46A4|nr:PepSY-like domain-containing protein [Sphingobacterium sp. SRCM116780]UIR54726.1 PepSY-like domain-containing protein [Sphingobacterium sp. SRCM116780]